MRRTLALRLSALAFFVVSGSTGIAHADTSDDDSVVGVHDNSVSAQVCHNQVPVNVLGVQVPVQDIAASLGLPIASDDSPSEGPDQSCNQSSAGGENDGPAGHSSGETERDSANDEQAEGKKDESKSPDDDHDKNGGLPGPLLSR